MWKLQCLAFLFCSSILGIVSAGEKCEELTTARAISHCLSSEVDSAEVEQERYLQRASIRYADDKQVIALLVGAQNAWASYRKAHCNAVYQSWVKGSIRTITLNQCRLDITRRRTHEIWQAYLTFEDSTPPLLPEPKL